MSPNLEENDASKNPEVSLQEIANWQLSPTSRGSFAVDLPKLQRGFVWDTRKVLDLWDSLLRGFPIGSMLLSERVQADTSPEIAGSTHLLLDGQQRATSISMGYYNPWDATRLHPEMWNLKSVPILWMDLKAEKRGSDTKMFFPYLVTQSHPWGYAQDGNPIKWDQRRKALADFDLGSDYTEFDLHQCFPRLAKLPLPMTFLLEVAQGIGAEACEEFQARLIEKCSTCLPEAWQKHHAEALRKLEAKDLGTSLSRFQKLQDFRVHLNILSNDAAENDTITPEDNSLLFVRLNTGGVVLGGEELVFSMFKSAFGEAKDAVEKCASGFMQPSKLFGLLVRLAAAGGEPSRLAHPVNLLEFKREIRGESDLKTQLKELIKNRAENLMQAAHAILCGSGKNTPAFCLPEAVATHTINVAPDIFLALLYWYDKGGRVDPGSEGHRQLLGRFTALSWFLPGNAKAKRETLRKWVEAAGTDVAGRLWSGECLRFMFTRKELAVPVFPLPGQLTSLLFDDGPNNGQLRHQHDYESLSGTAHYNFWKDYAFLPSSDTEIPEMRPQRLEGNLRFFLHRLRGERQMLLYAQREYLRKRFQAFGQWELTLKDTNRPWDWDHIYPSASGLHKVDKVYKSWHNTIGNLRAVGLSENRRDGCKLPTEKLLVENEHGTPAWKSSFISEDIWKEMQSLKYHPNAIKDPLLAGKISFVVLSRMVSIYKEWHDQLRIGPLMDEIRNIASDAGDRQASADPTPSAEFLTEPSVSFS